MDSSARKGQSPGERGIKKESRKRRGRSMGGHSLVVPGEIKKGGRRQTMTGGNKKKKRRKRLSGCVP